MSLAQERAPGGEVETIPVALGSRSYDVLIGSGLIAGAGGRIAAALPGARVGVVTDETVARLHLEALTRALRAGGVEAVPIVVPPGEGSKSFASLQHVVEALLAARLERGDAVAAFGGGVVGDLAGFAAAIARRGMRLVQIPTTLLAQVDSSVGGKTGINTRHGKNLVGAFHQPRLVLADLDVLDTLPPREFAAGYAEVVKTAVIAGGDLWARVTGGEAVDERMIVGCVRAKLAIVARDERDEGPRQALNLGHTVGHAIETATGYGRYRHGEAVGLGLLAALRLSGRDDLRGQVADLLARAGLPTALSGVEPQVVVDAAAGDKKRRGGQIGFVLVDAPGKVRTGCRVGSDELLRAVQELAAR